jgi:hypothetical protein
MSQVLKLPTQWAVWELPHWAQVAFGARCARRIMPLFLEDWPDAPAEITTLLWEQITTAETAAATGCPPTVDRKERALRRFSWEEEFSKHRIAEDVHWAIGSAADASLNAVGEAHGLIVQMLTEIQNAAEAAYQDLDSFSSLQRQIARDLTHLLALTEEQEWTDATTVPPTVFEPLDAPSALSSQGNADELPALQQQFVVESCKLGLALIQSAHQPKPATEEVKPATAETQVPPSRTKRLLKPLGQLIAWLVKSFS